MRNPEDKGLRLAAAWIVFPCAAVLCSPIWVAIFMFGASFEPDYGLTWRSKFAMMIGGGLWLFTVLIVTGLWYESARVRKYRESQTERDLAARKTIEDLESGLAPEPFFVYLRSFECDRLAFDWYSCSTVEDKSKNPLALGKDSLFATRFEDELAFSLPNKTLISLGDSPRIPVLGVPRIKVPDDDWRRAADLLLKHCSGIILCPWHTPGVLEETRRIAFNGDLLKKTVWFMPPARSGLKLADEWEKTTTAAATLGITFLPEYSPLGALFNIAADWQPIEGAITNQEELGECIKEMLESSMTVRIEVVQEP